MQELLSVSLMVSIKHKPIIDTQKIMRKESKHNATESHQTTREESRMRWLDSIIASVDMNLSKLWIVKDKEGWHAAVHGVEKSWTQLSD